MFSRQKIFAEGGSIAAGRDINIPYGLTGTPASFRGRVRRFLSYYLGQENRPVPFGGRETQLEQLDAWLSDPEAPPNLLIVAPAGRGKSALLVRWLQRIDAAAWPVAFVPISIRFETNRPDIFYQALAARLADVLGENLEEARVTPLRCTKTRPSSSLTPLPRQASVACWQSMGLMRRRDGAWTLASSRPTLCRDCESLPAHACSPATAAHRTGCPGSAGGPKTHASLRCRR
jgi:hypothetical protein